MIYKYGQFHRQYIILNVTLHFGHHNGQPSSQEVNISCLQKRALNTSISKEGK